MDFTDSSAKVDALFNPRNVVIVGASDRPGNWSARVWRNLQRYGYEGAVYPVNPRSETIWERPCYPDVGSLPEAPDHLVVLVPAPRVADVLRAGARAGARSATVFTSGFGESGDTTGQALERDLRAVIEETGIGISGPNCMGNISVPARLVTMTEDRLMALAPGSVALIGQSGGVMLFANRVLDERGMAARFVVSTGNETGLTTADYIAWLARDPETKAIVSYVEAVRDADRFLAACRLAQQAGIPVIMIKLGQSAEGRKAALAHTGSLAGTIEVFDAVAGDAGVIRVDSLDDVIETLEYVVHASAPKGRGLGAITLSGAYRGLLLDAASGSGLSFPPLAEETRATLAGLLGVGSIVGNPLDGGFGVLSSEETYIACIKALEADPNIDVLLLQEELPRTTGMERSERYMCLVENQVVRETGKPIAFVSLFSHSQSDHSRALRAAMPHLPFLQEANKTLRVLRHVITRRERTECARTVAEGSPPRDPAVDHCRAMAASATGPQAMNEVESKALLAAYGIAMPREAFVQSAAEAVAAANAIGYPLVLKGVSASITHKTEAGAVRLGVADEDALRAGWAEIAAGIEAHAPGVALDGMLVCEQISGGIELVIGLHRDPEMGPVVMFGRGGIWLELDRDVSFAAPPLSPARAADMVERTRVAALIDGWRGHPGYDRDAVVRSLVALGQMATDLGDAIDSVDINPLVALPRGRGAVALDGLVIVRGRKVG